MSVNKVLLIGNLGRDPEIRYSANGVAVGNLTIATTHRAKGQDGQWAEQTEWHRVTLFGKTAEVAGEFLRKGRPVYIEGRIQTRKWQDQSGQDRYTTEIIAENMQMLGGRGDGASGAQNQNHAPQSQQAPQKNYQATGGMPAMDDDIPFNAYFARNAYCI